MGKNVYFELTYLLVLNAFLYSPILIHFFLSCCSLLECFCIFFLSFISFFLLRLPFGFILSLNLNIAGFSPVEHIIAYSPLILWHYMLYALHYKTAEKVLNEKCIWIRLPMNGSEWKRAFSIFQSSVHTYSMTTLREKQNDCVRASLFLLSLTHMGKYDLNNKKITNRRKQLRGINTSHSLEYVELI